MRATLRLLAAVQKGGQLLEPGAPTGITGLNTAAAPRTTLLYLYGSTLEKLKELPESSVYRKSTEALTKQRLSIVESAKPAGLEEWQQRVKPLVDAHPETYRRVPSLASQQLAGSKKDLQSEVNIAWRRMVQAGTQYGNTGDEYDARAYKQKPQLEGPREFEEVAGRGEELQADFLGEDRVPEIEPEPALTAEQIGEIENKIGAGLIEEVIQVAEGELALVHTMAENKVWEDLEEKAPAGQWTYFTRDAHASGTQAP